MYKTTYILCGHVYNIYPELESLKPMVYAINTFLYRQSSDEYLRPELNMVQYHREPHEITSKKIRVQKQRVKEKRTHILEKRNIDVALLYAVVADFQKDTNFCLLMETFSIVNEKNIWNVILQFIKFRFSCLPKVRVFILVKK